MSDDVFFQEKPQGLPAGSKIEIIEEDARGYVFLHMLGRQQKGAVMFVVGDNVCEQVTVDEVKEEYSTRLDIPVAGAMLPWQPLPEPYQRYNGCIVRVKDCQIDLFKDVKNLRGTPIGNYYLLTEREKDCML